jgi:hypothetical protein
MKRALLALAMGLLCFGNSALADTVVKWNGIAAQLPGEAPVGPYLSLATSYVWTGGGSATLNLTTGAYQFQVKYLSWALPTDPQPIGATLDKTIPLGAVFVCDSFSPDSLLLGPVTFYLDKTGSANIQGVLMDKLQLSLCADTKDKIAFLIIDESNKYFLFGTGRQFVTSTQNNQK